MVRYEVGAYCKLVRGFMRLCIESRIVLAVLCVLFVETCCFFAGAP